MLIVEYFENFNFPNIEKANKDGLLGFSFDISVEQVLKALTIGIFPWYEANSFPFLWWAPDPRFVVFPNKIKVSKSLKQSYKKFEFAINKNFEQVIFNCANINRRGQNGTWIDDEMIFIYTQLYRLGYGMSFETYFQGDLVGGLYGVNLGGVFIGESMFYTKTDASKSAFVFLANYCLENNIKIIDCQLHTPLLESLGGEYISRNKYSIYLSKFVEINI